MIFQITKASDYKYKENVEINTLEELVKLSNKYSFGNSNGMNEGIIVKGNQIEIYDDYVE